MSEHLTAPNHNANLKGVYILAIEQNTTKKIMRNGFAAVIRMDIQNTAGVTLEQIEVIGALFRAIERLTTDDTI